MNRVNVKYTRFNVKLSKEQKQFFEKAAYQGGYRNLTDFIIQSVQEKAKEIISKKEQINISEQDSQIFFDAITNHQKPSESLKSAFITVPLKYKNAL